MVLKAAVPEWHRRLVSILLSNDHIDQLCASNLHFLLWVINYWSLTEHPKPAVSGVSRFFLLCGGGSTAHSGGLWEFKCHLLQCPVRKWNVERGSIVLGGPRQTMLKERVLHTWIYKWSFKQVHVLAEHLIMKHIIIQTFFIIEWLNSVC